MGIYNAYNPQGQRLQKNSGTVKTYFAYDEQGKLIGEYDQDNTAIREYIYLGSQPIAMITVEKADEVLQIHSDHLGTPRAVTNADNEKLWQWEGDAFGNVSPQIAQVKMPLRMAGQYADSETGLFYNYFRFYDPATGRYVTSDPIGLQGGMNTYGYVGGSPLGYVDPKGLAKWEGAYVESSVDIFALPLNFDVAPKALHFTLKSECIDGVEYIESVLAASAGINNDMSITKPFSFGAGTTELDDGNGRTPNPYAFSGTFYLGNLSIPFFTLASTISMGNAKGRFDGWGLSSDIFALEGYYGYSVLMAEPVRRSCDCE